MGLRDRVKVGEREEMWTRVARSGHEEVKDSRKKGRLLLLFVESILIGMICTSVIVGRRKWIYVLSGR